MSVARLDAAKKGAISILETLQNGDMLCIFTFDHGVQQIIETVDLGRDQPSEQGGAPGEDCID